MFKFLCVPTRSSVSMCQCILCNHVCSSFLILICIFLLEQFNFNFRLLFNMLKCSVRNCKNRKGLHKFPVIMVLRIKWTLFCRRKPGWTPGPSARICSAHFAQNSFTSMKRRFLVEGAVQSLTGTCIGNVWCRYILCKNTYEFPWDYGDFNDGADQIIASNGKKYVTSM